MSSADTIMTMILTDITVEAYRLGLPIEIIGIYPDGIDLSIMGDKSELIRYIEEGVVIRLHGRKFKFKPVVNVY